MDTNFSNTISNSYRKLAKAITCIENHSDGFEKILESIQNNYQTPVIGFTGPPGAGKSTLISAFIHTLIQNNRKVAVLAVDPSSPFNKGAILGDRLRMSAHFEHPHVFIRSLATRGNLGGLSPYIYEIIELLKNASFDYILIETVGVGQSEVEIAALADTTVVVLVPEAGDEIQAMKSGLLEIADVYVVNKSDRDHADVFYKNIRAITENRLHDGEHVSVVKTIASDNVGLDELLQAIESHHSSEKRIDKQLRVMSEQALNLIRIKRTSDVSLSDLENEIRLLRNNSNFNLYTFIKKYFN